MTRTAFLAALEQLLAPLPEAERKDALSYYEDYLDAMPLTILHFLSRPLIHVAHRPSESIPFLVH